MKSIFVVLFAIISLAGCGAPPQGYVDKVLVPTETPNELYTPHAPYDPGPPQSITPKPKRPKPRKTTHRASRSRRVTMPLTQGGVWDRLAVCESTSNWSANTGNGYYGGLQFSLGTWRAYGGTGMPHHASRETQIRIAKNILADQGWKAWPYCSRKLGLR